MRFNWSRYSPRGGFEDFLAYWRQPTPYRWQIMTLSVALTFTLMVLFVPESERAEPRRPDITFITTFEPGRTDEQIRESNLENQARQEVIEAQREALEERKRQLYRDLGRATGVDVDAMEERIEADRAAQAAEAALRAERAEARRADQAAGGE
jgi:hypothetical protein